MIIALDQEIPYWEEAFSSFGEVRPFPGRMLKPEDIRDIDALIVRTVTPINERLLKESPVAFVGAASAGYDHVDLDYLKARNIHFEYSAGCNANAVSEYLFTALNIIAERQSWDLKKKSLGIIGVGHVGSRVAQKAAALGMQTLLCDPPLHEITGDPKYLPFEKALEADIITFHVPLTDNGPHPTWHMLNESVLKRLSPSQFVINASRGPVVDNQALKHALSEKHISGAIIDVWEDEPDIDYSLVELVDIATPHIAGTSWDGKIRATDMVRQCLSDFRGVDSSSIIESHAPESVTISPERGMQGQSALVSALLKAVDLRQFDAALRALRLVDAPQAAVGFDRLRKTFPLRPEFHHLIVELDGNNAKLCDAFAALGFKTRINQAA